MNGRWQTCGEKAALKLVKASFTIEGGRISKLMIKRDGEIVCNYDRSWDVNPVDEDTEFALAILMKDYN